MVRRLVHALTSVGQARLSVEEFNRYLDNGLLNPVQGLAPAQGLVLAEVIYSPEADTLGQEIINRNFGEG
jgi:tRNA U38,U39,U40 pseudouridine synthase TruA